MGEGRWIGFRPNARFTIGGDGDDDLLRRVAGGDPAAVRALTLQKLPRILALAGRMLGDTALAEDIAQEAFVRVWRQAPRWKPGRARFDTWLHRVTLNLCYDHLRRRPERPVGEPPDQVDDGPAPDHGLMVRDTARDVQAALARLPGRQREAIMLVYFQDLPNREAAEVMRLSVDALESLVHRARQALRTALQNQTSGGPDHDA